jgi:tetratricopeptide (TPR) repeat protein
MQSMLVRWILLLAFAIQLASAIQRPETKATLRSLARLPRVEPRFSLDFDADRGFSAFDTSKDSTLAVAELRERLSGSPTRVADAKLLLQIAAIRQGGGDGNAYRDFQHAADALRLRLDLDPSNARLKINLASALHALGRGSEAESLFREAVKASPNSTNEIAFSLFLESRAWEIAADTTNWRGRRSYNELCRRMLRRQPSVETADRAARFLEESLAAAREAVRIDGEDADAQQRLGIALASKECFEAMRRRLAGHDFAAPPIETAIFSEAALPALEKAAELEPENPIRRATVILWRALGIAAQKRIPINDAGLWDFLPEQTRRQIENDMESLERFASASNNGAAAQAIGTLRFVLRNDLRAAADDFRRAIGFIPDSEQLWETLCLVLSRSDDNFELAAISEARVMIRPSVHNRVLFASALEKLGNRARAVEELNIALALNSTDYAANLSLAALLMRDADDDPDELSPRVRQALINAERAVHATATGPQLVDLALAQSIYHGLIDEPETARELLKAALAYDKDDPALSAALNAIGY